MRVDRQHRLPPEVRTKYQIPNTKYHSVSSWSMPVDAVSTFLATGALLIAVLLVALVVLVLAARMSTRAADTLASLQESFDGLGPKIALTMAAVATAGSLYYSQVAGFIPCEYCWYQRIAMYPLVPVLFVGVRTGDRSVRRYVLPIAIIGSVIAAYHTLIENFPEIAAAECSGVVACTAPYVQKFGFVGIPFMALMAFGVIIAALLLDRSAPSQPPSTSQEAL
jgi:disulfide bond formation protein DsbB